jgi:hypothetical protein
MWMMMWMMTWQVLSGRPYVAVRHPMYAGLVWGSVGAAMLTGSHSRILLATSSTRTLHPRLLSGVTSYDVASTTARPVIVHISSPRFLS